MAKINLLPWRQAQRAVKKREFFIINFGVAAIAAGLVVMAHVGLSEQVSEQQGKNAYIKNEISQLDTQIKEIDELQKRRDELMSRMKVIQDLQGRRPIAVRVFDEFVRTLPDGVYFKTLERTGDTFKIQGVAESKNEVSQLMRNLDASPWFKSPQLSNVVEDQPKDANGGSSGGGQSKKADAGLPSESNQFALTVQLEIPADPASVKSSTSAGSLNVAPADTSAGAAAPTAASAAPAPSGKPSTSLTPGGSK